MAEPIRRGLCQTRFPAEIPARIMQSAPRMAILAGTNSRTRGSRLEGKAKRGRDSFEARTRGNRTNFDATIKNRFCCKLKKWLWIFFFGEKQ